MARAKTCPFRKLERLTFEDLDAAFSPNPDPEAVNYAWNTVYGILDQMTEATVHQDGGEFWCHQLSGRVLDEDEMPRQCDIYDKDGSYAGIWMPEEGQYIECDCPKEDGGLIQDEADIAHAKIVYRCVDGKPFDITSDWVVGLHPDDILSKFKRAKTIPEKLSTLNAVVQLVHGRGPLADNFVVGGTKTLDKVHEQRPSFKERWNFRER